MIFLPHTCFVGSHLLTSMEFILYGPWFFPLFQLGESIWFADLIPCSQETTEDLGWENVMFKGLDRSHMSETLLSGEGACDTVIYCMSGLVQLLAQSS